MKPIITIDGPAASGKTSVSRGVAMQLGLEWISTGAFYRGLAFVAKEEDVDFGSASKLVELCHSNIWEIKGTSEETQVYYSGKNVTVEIQQEAVGNLASKISSYPEVREALLKGQRDLLINSKKGLVAEGRDCGSVIFPQSPFKFYLTARSESRAQRRADEHGGSVNKLKKEQEKRDASDSKRKIAPLQVPEGAQVVDTSDLGLEEVIAKVLSFIDI